MDTIIFADYQIDLFNIIEEKDKTIIDNRNSRVSDKDDVYILGDFLYEKNFI